MSRSRPIAGAALFELLVTGFIVLAIGAGIIAIVRTTYIWQTAVTDENAVSFSARVELDTVSDRMRAATIPPGKTAAFVAAAASDVTFYKDTSSNTIRYWRDTVSGYLKSTWTVSGTASTTVVLTGVQAFTLTYYKIPSGYNPPVNSWTTTTNPSAPTGSELPQIGAIRINAVVT